MARYLVNVRDISKELIDIYLSLLVLIFTYAESELSAQVMDCFVIALNNENVMERLRDVAFLSRINILSLLCSQQNPADTSTKSKNGEPIPLTGAMLHMSDEHLLARVPAAKRPAQRIGFAFSLSSSGTTTSTTSSRNVKSPAVSPSALVEQLFLMLVVQMSSAPAASRPLSMNSATLTATIATSAQGVSLLLQELECAMAQCKREFPEEGNSHTFTRPNVNSPQLRENIRLTSDLVLQGGNTAAAAPPPRNRVDCEDHNVFRASQSTSSEPCNYQQLLGECEVFHGKRLGRVVPKLIKSVGNKYPTDFSIALWMRPSRKSPASSCRLMVFRGEVRPSAEVYFLVSYNSAKSTIGFWIRTPSGLKKLDSVSKVNPGKWTHLAVTCRR